MKVPIFFSILCIFIFIDFNLSEYWLFNILFAENKVELMEKKLDIYSPGVGTQGGSVKKAIANGSDFLIVGRTILGSKNPVRTATQLM